MPAIELSSEDQYNSLASKGVVVLDFWADWCQPCVSMNAIFDQLADTYTNIKFIKVEAEKFSDITEKHEVGAVPTFVILKDGKVAEKIEGANAPDLANKVTKYNQQATVSVPQEDLNTRLQKLINFAPVMVFIKGTPAAPQCGFSSKLLDILKKEGIKYSSFNILSDEEVRNGLKAFSNWPTYPQVYVNGKLIGGLDIIKEMQEEGELLNAIPENSRNSTSVPTSVTASTTPASTGATEPKEDLNSRLGKLVSSSHVMLFMKGSPEEPKCGFSKKIVAVLNKHNVQFGSFNILADEEVRTGLKTFSNWPTYPQLYVKGKLIGGLDIVTELSEEGELDDIVKQT